MSAVTAPLIFARQALSLGLTPLPKRARGKEEKSEQGQLAGLAEAIQEADAMASCNSDPGQLPSA